MYLLEGELVGWRVLPKEGAPTYNKISLRKMTPKVNVRVSRYVAALRRRRDGGAE